MGRYGAFAFLLVTVRVFGGTIGIHYIGELSRLDSFHMASMILTGMGPVAEMGSACARLFSSLYALYSGVVILSISAVFFALIIHRLLHILHVEEVDGQAS